MAVGLLSGTARAATLTTTSTTWTEDSNITNDVTINSGVTVNSSITLTIPTGVALNVNGGINANGFTLTVSGDGRLIVTGTTGANGSDDGAGNPGGNGFTGNMIVNGAEVTITGGKGGKGGNGVNTSGGNGGNGGDGIKGNITVNSGSVTITGGNGDSTGIGGNGGNGIKGNITVSSGSVTITGGTGGYSYSGKGRAVTGAITASSVQESDNGTNWTTLSGSTSSKRYVKAETSGPVEYQEASVDISGNVTFTTKSADTYTLVDATTTTWSNDKFYVVSGSVTISSRITVSGTANLILVDGATLNANAGITVASGNTLNIYAQSGGTGKLVATGGGDNAGIGGGIAYSGGTINIHGGSVTAKGGSHGAGIGGGSDANGGTVTIYGGSVTATGGSSAVGIGHGMNKSSNGTLTVASGLIVMGGNDANSANVLQSPYNTRYQYMKVGTPIPYIKYTLSGDEVISAEKTQIVDAIVSTSTTTFENGKFYVVSGSVTISNRITVSGEVNLILADGATLTANKGIKVASDISDNTLNIYAQSGNTGKLIATGGNNAAGIGGTGGGGGVVNIHGGTVTATGGTGAAGIGGAYAGSGGTVNIYGGTVTATGASQAAGIGGGEQGFGGDVNIHGGIVTATGGDNAMGIGRGSGSNSNGNLTVASGLVVIGGNDANSATVINDPASNRSKYMKVGSSAIQYVAYTVSTDITQVVSAEQTAVGFTIVSTDTTTWDNGGWYVVSGSVTISNRITVNGTANLILADGATLTANAGIELISGNTLNIYAQSGGTGALTATAKNSYEPGIGGDYKSGGKVNIHGGIVTATGKFGGAGIGGGQGGSGDDVTIYSGTVTATGGANGAGIGGGYRSSNAGGSGGNVTIYGGTVTATGGNNAKGIGRGNNGTSDGTLIVGSGLVVIGGNDANSATVINELDSNRSKYMKVFQHDHNFTDYQLSGDMTITAVCSNADGHCPLTNFTATLIIVAPTTDGGAAVLSGDASAFRVSSSDIKYQQKTNGTWGSESSTVPSGSGFFKASITVGGKTAFVTYGVSAITVASGITHGTVTAPSVATVNVVVPLTISPDTGYELDTLTPAKTSGGASISVTTDANGNKSFIMPDEEVTVNATFKLADYKISFDITSGSITVPETAHYNNTVRFVITPDKGYGVYSFTIPGVELNLVSRDTDTGVEIYEITMPNKDITVNLQLKETTIYTIFYKADNNVNSILYRFSSSDAGFKMKKDAKVDDTACWGGQMRGLVDKTSFTISFKVDEQNWTDLTCNVVDDLSGFNSLSNGNAVLISGDESAFVASFMWGYYDTDENGNLQIRSDYGMRYYFVTPNTTSISVPNPTRRGYDFAGWVYPGNNYETKTISAGSGNTTVNIKDNISKTTLFGAIWQRQSSTITYDLNGGSWSGANTATVLYGNKLTKPADPTRNAYAFNGWVVKSKTRAIKGSQGVTLGEGSNFDFDTTKITENITLRAAWKHVHAYVRLPLSKINDVIPGALSQATINKYKAYVHFAICSHADDDFFEGHVYDKNGKCACGAVKPTPTVTLEETYGNRNSGLIFVSTPKKDSEVVLVAPQMGTNQFVKWEYRSLNGSTWRDLVSTPVVGFIIPGSLRVNAVYQSLNAPQLTLQAERYNNDGILFTMQYALPKGWKATNAYVIYGDNHMLRYMEVVRSHTPWATLELSDPFLGIPIPGTQLDIGTFDEATHYYDREDNILAVAENKGPLRYKMLNGEAVNIPGYNEAIGKKAQNLGQTSGYAYGGLTDVNKNGNNNRYFYVLGFVEYTDAANAKHMAAVGPIAVTYNSLSSAVTETEIHTYNY